MGIKHSEYSSPKITKQQKSGRKLAGNKTTGNEAVLALYEGDEQLQTVINNMSDGLIISDLDGKLLHWNPAALAYHGYTSSEELCRLKLSEFTNIFRLSTPNGAVLPFEQWPMLRILRGEQLHNFEVRVSRIDMDWERVFSYSGTVVHGAIRKPLAFLIITDITERKRTEKALRESEEKFRLFIEHAPSAIAMLDNNMRYMAYSQRWLADYNLGERDITGHSHYEIFPDIPDRWKDVHRRCLAGAIEKCEEDIFQRANGNVEWNRWEIVPWLASSGSIGGIIIFSEVITERKQAEMSLRESEERFSLMADSAPVLIWMANTEGLCTYFNQGWLSYTGKTLEQEQGNGWTKGVHPDDLRIFLETFNAAFNARKPYTIEKRLRRYDGEYRWLLDTGIPRYTANGVFAGYIGTCVDITGRKEAEEELRELSKQLRILAGKLQSVREEERTRIAREIHDVLAQELTRLKLDVVWASKRLTKPVDETIREVLFEKLQDMTDHADTAIQTVQKIATELRPVILDNLGLLAAIEWQVEDFEQRTDIPCQVVVPVDEPLINREQATAIFRILQESLTNVVRHAQATRVKVQITQEHEYLMMTVHDNGCGIKPKKLYDSHSIGLLGMRERTFALGGSVQIMGTPDSGTTVTVKIPLIYPA